MTAKEYLQTHKAVNLTYIAKLMWPKSEKPNIYLHMKLSGVRKWTEQNEKDALKHLHDLGIELSKLK